MSTLAAILAHPIIGNAHSDAILFELIHVFVMDPANTMSDKVQAITKLDCAMDLNAPNATEEDVLSYIEFETQTIL